jgi:hypothetical protein
MRKNLVVLCLIFSGLMLVGLIGCTTTTTTATGNGVTDPSHAPSNNDLSAASYVGSLTCKECHGPGNDDGNEDVYTPWKNSAHASVIGSGASSNPSSGCGFCHATGYKQTGGYSITSNSTTEAGMYTVQCEMCHGPGSLHTPEAAAKSATINKVPDAIATCGRCHRGRPFVVKDANGRYDSLVDMDNKTAVNASIEAVRGTSGTLTRHPIHYRPNLPVFKGTGGYEYSGSTYTSSFHTSGISNACVVCHLQFGTDKHDLEPDLAACNSCHTGVITFDVDGKNTEILGLLQTLGAELGSYEAAVTRSARTAESYTKALWNFYLITRETDAGKACAGVHNYRYAKQLLQDAINNFDPADR